MVLLIIRCVVLVIIGTANIILTFAFRLGDLSILVLIVFVIFPSILALGVSSLCI